MAINTFDYFTYMPESSDKRKAFSLRDCGITGYLYWKYMLFNFSPFTCTRTQSQEVTTALRIKGELETLKDLRLEAGKV